MSEFMSAKSRGSVASIASSVVFGIAFFITPMLAPLTAEAIWAIRTLIALPFVAFVLASARQLYLISNIWYRVKKKPALLLGIATTGLIFGAQHWVFAWAPLHGQGTQVALGYFLLPLVLVFVGKFLYKDALTWWHWLAAGIASIGVTLEVIRVGEISWPTLLVALGYPVYFIIRRAMGMAHVGGMFWEFLIVTPLIALALWFEFTQNSSFVDNPTLIWLAPLFGVFASFGLWLFILASKLLPISLFGLLTYLEPALLMVAAVLIGERIGVDEFGTYIAIWVAVLVLLVGGTVDVVKSRRRRDGTGDNGNEGENGRGG